MKLHPVDFATYGFPVFNRKESKEHLLGAKDFRVELILGNPASFCENIVMSFGKRNYVFSLKETEILCLLLNNLLTECYNARETN